MNKSAQAFFFVMRSMNLKYILNLLTCKSKCKFVRVNATAKFKNFDSLLQIWGKSLYNGVECVKINSIRQEIGKKAKNSQRSDCRLLFCKGKSHP